MKPAIADGPIYHATSLVVTDLPQQWRTVIHLDEWNKFSTPGTTNNQNSIKPFVVLTSLHVSRKRQLDEGITRVVAEGNLSLNRLKLKPLREWIEMGVPGYSLPSVHVMRNALIPARYGEVKELIKDKLSASTANTIILDIWSSKIIFGSYEALKKHFRKQHGFKTADREINSEIFCGKNGYTLKINSFAIVCYHLSVCGKKFLGRLAANNIELENVVETMVVNIPRAVLEDDLEEVQINHQNSIELLMGKILFKLSAQFIVSQAAINFLAESVLGAFIDCEPCSTKYKDGEGK
ncbi:Uncharacterized protein APZ42_032048 [Daphnia magna]|uniref:Uncharacterized protein n=1 Tax=Daphnia magna TaxID=35525 RepID=A0A162DA89_9CRUS|nr:Uncharacterized protein APZ42_032048 [Daphnia magna]